MRRCSTIVLLLCFFALGTGVLQYVHELCDAAEDARENAAAIALAKATGQPMREHHHDESNCQVCAELHLMAMISVGWTPILICLGLFVVFLTLLDMPLIARSQPVREDCRGPPSLISGV